MLLPESASLLGYLNCAFRGGITADRSFCSLGHCFLSPMPRLIYVRSGAATGTNYVTHLLVCLRSQAPQLPPFRRCEIVANTRTLLPASDIIRMVRIIFECRARWTIP
jgi:hypothetical protein